MTNSKSIFNVVLVLGLIVLVVVLINYNNKKSPKDNMYSYGDVSKNVGNSLALSLQKSMSKGNKTRFQ